MPILPKEELNELLLKYYDEKFGRLETDIRLESSAVNVLSFQRGNKIIDLKAHILTGEIEETYGDAPQTEKKPASDPAPAKKQVTYNFEGKNVVITGGGNGIGKCIRQSFEAVGAKVYDIDLINSDYFIGDIGDKETLDRFAIMVLTDTCGTIDYLINNAPPMMKGIDNCTYEEFEYALKVGVTAPFYLSKLFAPHFNDGGSIINISSSRDRMSQPNTESYTAAKGGISALTHALAVSLAGKVRVNSVSPGWIDNNYTVYEGADALQQPAGRVGIPPDIADTVLFLCSDMAGFITGENICVDGGMTRNMIYHGDFGWSLDTNK